MDLDWIGRGFQARYRVACRGPRPRHRASVREGSRQPSGQSRAANNRRSPCLSTRRPRRVWLGRRGLFHADQALTAERMGGARYSPPTCIGATRSPLMGKPDMAFICTSHVERQNLTVRMQMRRFTRLTNAFSKKAENHIHAVALHFMAYNYCRPHGTLTKKHKGIKYTPAMECGLTDHVWTWEEILEKL